MEETKNILQFDLSSKQIKFKDILSKEFVELEVWAISDADPNRNNSHFTYESLKKAVENGSMKNKPIVGFFENNNFTTHEGHADYDLELDKKFWNTEKGERILGWIRESDPVELVEKDGLHWVKFRCILCTTYCYAQVKRLLKDRRKKVSVEITVHESDKREDGVLDILDFTLNGTTILGSKNGKEVLEGIPGAHLSILENLDTDALMAQKTALSFAYEKAFGADEDKSGGTAEMQPPEQKSEGKEETKMENESAVVKTETVEDFAKDDIGTMEKEAAEHCEFCEDYGCKTEEAIPLAAEHEDAPCKCPDDNGELEMGGCENSEKEDCVEPAKLEDEHSCDDCGGDNHKDDDGNDEDDCDEMCKLSKRCAELEAKCAEYCGTIAKMSEDFESKRSEYEAEIAKYSDYAEIKERMEKAEAKLYEQFCLELKAYAESIMANERIEKSDRDAVIEKCVSGKYSTKEEIFAEVAVAAFKTRTPAGERFSSAFEVPAMGAGKAEDKKPMSREERMKARVAKCGKK